MFKSPGNEFLSMQKQQEYEKKKIQNRKKFTSPANEFLLHKYRNNRKMKKYIFFFKTGKKITNPDNEFLHS